MYTSFALQVIPCLNNEASNLLNCFLPFSTLLNCSQLFATSSHNLLNLLLTFFELFTTSSHLSSKSSESLSHLTQNLLNSSELFLSSARDRATTHTRFRQDLQRCSCQNKDWSNRASLSENGVTPCEVVFQCLMQRMQEVRFSNVLKCRRQN